MIYELTLPHLLSLPSLIGLLSFMSSEEMTTGSVSSSNPDRKTFATRSHEWNIKQKKFTTLFPEYSKVECVDLPNMGKPGQPGGGDLKVPNSSTSTTTTTSTSTSNSNDSALKVRSNPSLSSLNSDKDKKGSLNLESTSLNHSSSTVNQIQNQQKLKVKEKKEGENKIWKSSTTTVVALIGAGLACLYAKGAGWI